MAKAVSYLQLFLFVGHSEAATSHPSKNYKKGKSCLSFFSLMYLLWQSELVAQVSSCTRYSFLAATNSSAHPFYSRWVFTHPFHLTVTTFPSHIFFSTMALSLEMYPMWQDDNTGCNCTALTFCLLWTWGTHFSPTSGILMSFTSPLNRRTFISLRKITWLFWPISFFPRAIKSKN